MRTDDAVFRAIIEKSRDVVALVTPTGVIKYDSPAVKLVLGYQAGELAGRSSFEIIHEEEHERARAALREVLAEPGRSVSMGFRCRHKNGEFRWVEGTATNLMNDPAVGAVVLNYRDVTDRRSMEQRLREQEASLALAQQVSRIGSWELKPSKGCTLAECELKCSAELLRMIGLGTGEYGGTFERYFHHVHPTDRERVARELCAAAKHKTGATVECRIVAKDGSERFVRLIAAAESEPNTGDLVRMHGTVQDVTERRMTEKALEDSERRYRQLVETLPAAIYTCDVEGRITLFNEAAATLWGRRPEIGKDLWCGSWRIRKSDGSEIPLEECPMARAIKRGSSVRGQEIVVIRPDGSERWVLPYPDPIRSVDGTLLGAVNMLVDITERREAETRQRENNEFIANVLDSMTSRVAVVDESGRIQAVNEAWRLACDSYGDGNCGDCLVGEQFAEVHQRVTLVRDKEVADDVVSGLKLVLAGNANLKVFEYSPEESRNSAWFELRVARLTGSRRGALIIQKNITDRRAREIALRESEQNFRQLAENVGEVFWLATADKRQIIYVSPAYERIWGRSCQSLYDASSSWMELIHPDDRSRVAIAARSKQITGAYDEEYRLVREDGSIRWIRDRAFPVRDERGRVVRIAGIADDITHKKTVEAQSLRSQRLESLGTLAGGIAHDLNNVLAPMLMSVQLLRRDLATEKKSQLLETVETCARRGADLVRQVMAFARGAPGERRPVGPKRVLREIEQIIGQTMDRTIQIQLSTVNDCANVLGDSTQLQQVLLNLCVNARDAMPQGGVLTVRATNTNVDSHYAVMHPGARPGPHVLIEVTDTGGGIPPEIIQRIYDPFFTTKAIGEGTGLGLATVQAIVRSHGGFIRVDSKVGQGTTFSVFLPADVTGGASAAVEEGTNTVRGNGELILVIDDEAPVREVCRITLEDSGYEVLCAANGAEGLALLAQNKERVALVLTDMMMPVMDGAATIQAIHHITPKLPIIASSGLNTVCSVPKGVDGNRVEFLRKPYTGDLLVSAIQRVLAKH